MNQFILVIMLGLFSFHSNGQNLEYHQWKNRVLILKTGDKQSEQYQEQLDIFKSSPEEFEERKLVLYEVLDEHYDFIDYKFPYKKSSGKVSNKLMSESLSEQNDFEVMLIGLDGGIKLRQNRVLTKAQLFGTIDAMPMRRQELQRKKY